MNKICITHDIDWAADFVIDEMLDMLDKLSIKSTIFCTHKVKIPKHELGIHPYFKHGELDEDDTLQKIMKLFPNAKGTRSHRLMVHNSLFNHYEKFGLEYDSNYLMCNQITKPFFTFKGILEIPLFYEDDLSLYPLNDFNPKKFVHTLLNSKVKDAVITFNFHPIHLYLNTKSFAQYDKARPDLKNEKTLKNHINKGHGIKTTFYKLFEELNSFIWDTDYGFRTLGEINTAMRSK